MLLCAVPLVGVFGATSAWAARRLGGVYSWGPGRVAWGVGTEGHVVAHALPGLTCPYASNEPVIEAEWQGSLLVGTVLLCQSGEGCATERRYPLFALYDPSTGNLRADFVLKRCSSPALSHGTLLLVPEAPDAGTVDASSYSEKGRALLLDGKLSAAKEQFREALDAGEPRIPIYMGLGRIEMRSANYEAALAHFESALRLEESPDVHYALAGTYSRLKERAQSVKHLKLARALGFHDVERMASDPDLRVTLHADAAFTTLVRQMRDANGRKAAR